MATIVQKTITGIGELLSFLGELQEDIGQARAFINMMGWELPPGLDDIGLASLDFASFLAKLDMVIEVSEEEWQDELAMFDRVTELTLGVNELVEEILSLALDLPAKLASFGDYVDRTNIHVELPKRLFDFLIVNYLAGKSPLGFALLHLINVVDYVHFDADPDNFQVEHVRPVIHYQNFETLISDPALLVEETYGWNTEQFSAMRLLQRLTLLFQALGMRTRIQPLGNQAEETWLGSAVPGSSITPQLITFLYEEMGSVTSFRLGFSLFGIRPSSAGASDGGLGLVPIVRGQSQSSIPFFRFDDTFIDFTADVDLLKGITLLLRPDQDLELRLAQSLSDTLTGRFALSLRHGDPHSEATTLFSLPGGSGMQIQQVYLMAGMEKHSDRPAESFMELGLLGGRFAFSMDQADSFIKNGIPQKKVESTFDLRVRWTSDQGIYFEGSSGLILTMPVHTEIGPFTLNSLTLGLNLESGGLEFQSAIAGSLKLGPLLVTIRGLGLEVDVSFDGGNLGLFGLSPRFKPPTGIGLVIDGGGFKGGGFLDFEAENQRYVGMLELEYQDKITLKAIGLLTTRLPGGVEGFSLLIVITAEFAPIQLGFGFTLNGVGGLLGLNRTANVERLRTGIRDNTLSSILFPADIVENANRIISDLRQVFPPQADRFIFGPMARIGWGTPTLITIDLGLLIEVPDPVRIILLGVVKALLPDEEFKLLRLQVNFLGVIDFEARMLSFDASLFASKLLSFTLSGDMAVRLTWGADPNFLMTVGGFHPAYEPPPLALPNLRRLTLQLLEGNNPRLTLETYFAITSNTVQLGSRLELYASAGKFNVYGYLSFDVLFQFSPFYFIAAIGAMLALRIGSSAIASISLSLTLEGPTPWHAKGTATLKLCWFIKIKVRFNKTFGETRDTRLDDIEVLPLLQAALSNKGNWEAQLPTDRHLLVSLKEIEAIGDRIIVHPFGVLTVKQKVVPLNLDIQKFGNQLPADASRFTIDQVLVGESGDTETLGASNVPEHFAPAQFFEKSDSQKLSGKSFEQYDAGVKFDQSEEMDSDYAASRVVEYELFYIDAQRSLNRWRALLQPDLAAFNTWATQGAIANSPLSHARNAKSALSPDAVAVAQEAFVVVNVNDLRPANGQAQAASEAGAYHLMNQILRDNPHLEDEIQVVPAFEASLS